MATSNPSTPHVPQATAHAAFFPGFATLRDLLDLVAMLRDPSEPIGSPEGLRRAIDSLLKLGESLGVDPQLLAKLRTLIENPRLFDVVLAIARYMLGLIEYSSQTASGNRSLISKSGDLEPQAIDPSTWLAIILEVISLLQRLRQRS